MLGNRMFFITYHAEPNTGIQNSEIGGAYINCWIEAESIDQAEQMARTKIEEENWTILDKEEAYEIQRSDYLENSNGLNYFDQALVDKLVLVFHTYPIH